MMDGLDIPAAFLPRAAAQAARRQLASARREAVRDRELRDAEIHAAMLRADRTPQPGQDDEPADMAAYAAAVAALRTHLHGAFAAIDAAEARLREAMPGGLLREHDSMFKRHRAIVEHRMRDCDALATLVQFLPPEAME